MWQQKQVFIHYYFKSVLLLWTKRCLLFFDGLSRLIVKQIFFFFFWIIIFYTVHWVCPSPQSCVPPISLINGFRVTDAFLTMSLLFTSCFLSRWFHSVLMNAKTNPWSQSKGFLCDAPTVRIPVAPTDGNVLLGNTWSSVNNPICFLMSHVTHPTLNELLARSLGVLSQTGIYGSEERLSGFSFQKALRFFFFFPIMGLLRCIVIKASQVFQSGSVAKLVLILEKQNKTKIPPFIWLFEESFHLFCMKMFVIDAL